MDIRMNLDRDGDVNTMQKVKMIVTNRFDPDVRVYKEAKYLVSKGFDVEILCWDREAEYSDKGIEIIDGISIRRFFPFAKYGSGYKQIIPYIKFIKECRNYLKGKDYGYLHCHDLDGVITGYFSKNINSKLIFDMHEFYEGQGSKQKIRYVVRRIVNYLQTKSDFIIYVNEQQKLRVRQTNINKLIFVPNYPDCDIFQGCEKAISKELRISYIGAVRQYNELKNLLDACIGINVVNISIHGAGTAYSKLKEIEAGYDNVKITGAYHFSQSAKLYSQTDILYVVYDMRMDNWRNAYPVKFFEAIITKTPVIVSKGSNLEKFIEDNDIGFAVDGSNIKKIRELIMRIVDNRYLLDEKIKTLDKIKFDYIWGNVVRNLNTIYLVD